jgi:hypothetical protein
MSRLRRTAVAIAAAASMAAAFTGAMTAPALAQSAHTTQSAQAGPCADGDGLSGGTFFWRCTGSGAASRYVGSSCNAGEYNAGDYYNVFGVINRCSTRVWLHELPYPDDLNSGYAVCIEPGLGTLFIPALYPQNIMVSGNSSPCNAIYP